MRKYEKYKDSNVPWIGEIPEHWDLKRMRFVARLYNGNSLNDTEKRHYADTPDDDDSMPYIASKDIDRDTEFIDYANGIRIPKNEPDFKVAPAGTSLLCIEGGSAGKKMGFVNQDVCFVNKLCCFDAVINNKFLYYYIKSKSFWEVFSQNIQGMIGGVSISCIKDFAVPLPSDEEQDAIVVYLDKKCAEIDKAITTQQKRIDLLKELKQKIIADAITKGINPQVNMKASGIFWIGQMPKHWEVKRIKFTGEARNGLTYSPNDVCSEEDGMLVLRSSNIQEGELSFEDNVYVSKIDDRLIVKPGDTIICSRNGSLSLVGKSAFVENKINATFGAFMLRYRSYENAKYAYYMVSTAIMQYKSLFSTTTVNQLTLEIFKDMIVSVPPKEEQESILKYLDRELPPIDAKIETSEQELNLLKEYKQSIITEVITGKRNVI